MIALFTQFLSNKLLPSNQSLKAGVKGKITKHNMNMTKGVCGQWTRPTPMDHKMEEKGREKGRTTDFVFSSRVDHLENRGKIFLSTCIVPREYAGPCDFKLMPTYILLHMLWNIRQKQWRRSSKLLKLLVAGLLRELYSATNTMELGRGTILAIVLLPRAI
ncbi:hypothetical protein C8R41DRAFT_871786 [Lentinula lateritia]|uniref:Uncharacterized protein n=1 Tax=Lentinula lateritia TaxID=40482 RepID=A0ABQ8V2F7_9AGAR|nr:hypothetical protein C8R41DRAFT_871786 [Lentinula lateritia]